MLRKSRVPATSAQPTEPDGALICATFGSTTGVGDAGSTEVGTAVRLAVGLAVAVGVGLAAASVGLGDALGVAAGGAEQATMSLTRTMSRRITSLVSTRRGGRAAESAPSRTTPV